MLRTDSQISGIEPDASSASSMVGIDHRDRFVAERIVDAECRSLARVEHDATHMGGQAMPADRVVDGGTRKRAAASTQQGAARQRGDHRERDAAARRQARAVGHGMCHGSASGGDLSPRRAGRIVLLVNVDLLQPIQRSQRIRLGERCHAPRADRCADQFQAADLRQPLTREQPVERH